MIVILSRPMRPYLRSLALLPEQIPYELVTDA